MLVGHYRVKTVPWRYGMELHIADAAGEPVGVTQTLTMVDAAIVVRDYLDADGREDCETALIVFE